MPKRTESLQRAVTVFRLCRFSAAQLHTPPTGPVRPVANSAAVHRPASVARITDGFWAQRRRTNAEVSLPEGPQRLEDSGNLANLRAAADAGMAPAFSGDFQFQDSDVYKWLEAACWQEETVRPLLRVPGEVAFHLLLQEGRKDDETAARVGLGGPGSALSIGPLGLGDATLGVAGESYPP